MFSKVSHLCAKLPSPKKGLAARTGEKGVGVEGLGFRVLGFRVLGFRV